MVSLQWFFLQVLQFLPPLYGSKAFAWLDRMLHHGVDPTTKMIGGANS